MPLRTALLLLWLVVACGAQVVIGGDAGTGGGVASPLACDAGNGTSCAPGTGCGFPRNCPGTGGGAATPVVVNLGYCEATGTVQAASDPFGYCPATFPGDGGAGCAMADGTTCPLGQSCAGGSCGGGSGGRVACWCEQSGGVPLCTGC